MIYLALLFLSPFCFSASGHTVTRHIELDRVEKLSISGGFHIKLSRGDPGITITGDKNIIDALEIKNEYTTLSLSASEKKTLWSWFGVQHQNSENYDIDIQVSLPHLDSLYLHGSSSAVIKEDLGIEKIELTGASTLDIRAPISPRELDVEIRGNSLFSSKSIKTNQLHLQQSGSGRSVFSNLNIREFAIFNITGRSSVNLINIHTNQLKLEGSGTSLFSLNTAKLNELTLELYGISATSIKSLKADAIYAFLHGSSSLNIKTGEAKTRHEHLTGFAKSNYGSLTVSP
jgi:hypothetical protein